MPLTIRNILKMKHLVGNHALSLCDFREIREIRGTEYKQDRAVNSKARNQPQLAKLRVSLN
jgi:hypothetical protein